MAVDPNVPTSEDKIRMGRTDKGAPATRKVGYYGAPMFYTSSFVKDMLTIIFRRKWAIISTCILCIMLGFWITSDPRPSHTSTATAHIIQKNNDNTLVKGVATNPPFEQRWAAIYRRVFNRESYKNKWLHFIQPLTQNEENFQVTDHTWQGSDGQSLRYKEVRTASQYEETLQQLYYDLEEVSDFADPRDRARLRMRFEFRFLGKPMVAKKDATGKWVNGVTDQHVESDYADMLEAHTKNYEDDLKQQIITELPVFEPFLMQARLTPEDMLIIKPNETRDFPFKSKLTDGRGTRYGFRTLDVDFTSESPRVSLAAVSWILHQIILENSKYQSSELESAIQFLEEQLVSANQDMKQAYDKFFAFRQVNPELLKGYVRTMPDGSQIKIDVPMENAKRQHDVTAREIDDLRSKIEGDQQNLRRIEEQLSGESPMQVTEVRRTESTEARRIKTLITNAFLDIEELKTKSTEAHPHMINLRRRVKTLKRLLEQEQNQVEDEVSGPNPLIRQLKTEKLETESRLTLNRARLNILEKERETIALYMKSLPAKQIQLEQYEAQYNNLKLRANDLTRRLQQARLDQKASELSIEFQWQTLPQLGPNEGDKSRLLWIVTIVIWLVLSSAVVFLLEYLDTTIRDVSDAQKHFNVMVMGVIPEIRSQKQMIEELRGKT